MQTNISWFFAVMCGIGSICWLIVRVLEGPKSAIELPAAKLIETEDDDMNAAALYTMLGAGEKQKPEAMLTAAPAVPATAADPKVEVAV